MNTYVSYILFDVRMLQVLKQEVEVLKSLMVATIPVLRQCLVDTKQPIQKRTHAAFFLRTDGSPEAVDAISAALVNKEDSALLRHELAYILGQIQNPVACKVLSAVLQDCSDDTMVRHEAAESLGAIGDPSAVQVLESFVNDPAAEVADTCKLSLELIRWRTGRQGYGQGRAVCVWAPGHLTGGCCCCCCCMQVGGWRS